ncbi:ABC transporter C family member 10-like [Populus alba x Populus x berolinensis]|nr:ABC transporter C family member 10-like [Populus alba x Populus x berolinensis]
MTPEGDQMTLVGDHCGMISRHRLMPLSPASCGRRIKLEHGGRALLRRSRISVLDEATASIDNATDLILQKTFRTEFSDCTVIIEAHRIPTVMDCTMVLAISDGADRSSTPPKTLKKLVEYDEPTKLMKKEGSVFHQLMKEYWSHVHAAESHGS